MRRQVCCAQRGFIHICITVCNWFFHFKKGFEIYQLEGIPSKNGKYSGSFTLLAKVSKDMTSYHVVNPKKNFDHTYKIRISDAEGYPGEFTKCGSVYAPSPGSNFSS